MSAASLGSALRCDVAVAGELTCSSSAVWAAVPVVSRHPAAINLTYEDIVNNEAFNTPLATLEDLWLVRFGHQWVDVDALRDDQFFGAAYERLRALGALEVHYLTDKAKFVCRQPE